MRSAKQLSNQATLDIHKKRSAARRASQTESIPTPAYELKSSSCFQASTHVLCTTLLPTPPTHISASRYSSGFTRFTINFNYNQRKPD